MRGLIHYPSLNIIWSLKYVSHRVSKKRFDLILILELIYLNNYNSNIIKYTRRIKIYKKQL